MVMCKSENNFLSNAKKNVFLFSEIQIDYLHIISKN